MNEHTMEETSEALKGNGFEPIIVGSKEEALTKIKELIPEGVSVMNGTSETLRQIGYIDHLKEGNHAWQNLHEVILAEADPEKQGRLRRESVVSDFYLGSAHALTQEGEIMIASNTGSQLSHMAYTSPNIILVVGKNKIVADLHAGFARVKDQVIPLEDERMKKVYGYGTTWTKTLVLHKENVALGRKVIVIMVNEDLGF